MSEPRWLTEDEVTDMHENVIEQFGGSLGVRERGLTLSALDRPRNQYAYGIDDLYLLAAYCAHGIGRNHPFIDGNKRVALTAAGVFLAKHGIILRAANSDSAKMTIDLVQDKCTVETFAAWLRDNSK